MIHKLAVDEAEESGSRAFQPLAADLQAIPGENQVEYEGIVVALLPGDEPSTAVEKAREAGHIAARFDDWSLELPSHRWDVRNTRVYAVNESESEKIVFDAAGQSWVSPVLRPHDPSQDLVIALVWNDIPTSPQSPALQRDLDLVVQEYQGSQYWVGNNFWENSNLVQSDTGYSQAYGFYGNYNVDRVNTVEVVAIPPGQFSSETRFQFVVSAFGLPNHSDFPTQSFSVYAWNLQCAGSC